MWSTSGSGGHILWLPAPAWEGGVAQPGLGPTETWDSVVLRSLQGTAYQGGLQGQKLKCENLVAPLLGHPGFGWDQSSSLWGSCGASRGLKEGSSCNES